MKKIFLFILLLSLSACGKVGDSILIERVGEGRNNEIYAEFSILRNDGWLNSSYIIKEEKIFKTFPEATEWLKIKEQENKELINKTKHN